MDVAEKEVSSTKEEQWSRAAEKIREIEAQDPHGLEMDNGVKKAVMGLDVLGFTTTSSCEGHVDHGNGYPYIRIVDPEALRQERTASNAYVLQRHADYERAKEKANRLNEALLARLSVYLDKFYTSRSVAEDIKLQAVLDHGRILLRNTGAEKQKPLSANDRQINLTRFQYEMDEFADFLEAKFFEK